jgi:hypothetical protein
LRGKEHSRLKSCPRWPEKGECGQECLAQVNPSPENVDRHSKQMVRRQELRDLRAQPLSIGLET